MRLLLRWSADRPEIGLELRARGAETETRASTLPASLRLGLLLAERGELTPSERRALVEAILAESAILELCRALPGAGAVLLEIHSSSGADAKRVARHLARWDGSGWRVGRAVSSPLLPLAVGVTVWRSAPPGVRGAARLLALCIAAMLVLTPPWWRHVERAPLLWSLRLLPAEGPRPSPTLGVILVPPEPGAARYDRAPLAAATRTCLDAGAPWIAIDVPSNRDAPGAAALWQTLSAAGDRVLAGVEVEANSDEPLGFPVSPDALSALALPWSGYGGGKTLGIDVNLQTTLSAARAGLPSGSCLPTLGWSMAERIARAGMELPPVFSAPGHDGLPVGWTPLVVPARALEIASNDLIITRLDESGWARACDPGRVSGVVLAYASWEEDPTFDRLELRVAGQVRGALLAGVEMGPQSARVPGPYAQALLAQALTTGPGFVPWHHALSAWLGRAERISPCGGSDLEVRAIPSRGALAVVGTALALAALGALARGLMAGAKSPAALFRRVGLGAAAWVVIGGLCMALARVYPPLVAGLCVVGLEAIRGLFALGEAREGASR